MRRKKVSGKEMYYMSAKDAEVPWDRLPDSEKMLWDIAAKAVNKRKKRAPRQEN